MYTIGTPKIRQNYNDTQNQAKFQWKIKSNKCDYEIVNNSNDVIHSNKALKNISLKSKMVLSLPLKFLLVLFWHTLIHTSLNSEELPSKIFYSNVYQIKFAYKLINPKHL